MSERLSRLAKHVILIIIDDVRADQFFQLYDQGKLPNMKKMGDTGILCRDCITTFPSITLPSQSTIMTGSYTGNYKIRGNGIPSYHWFDRDAREPEYKHYSMTHAVNLKDDIGPNCKTLFEQIEGGNSYSSFQICSRGVDKRFPQHAITGLLFALWYFKIVRKPEKGHPLVVKKILDAFHKPEKFFGNKEKPIAVTGYFPITDYLMHTLGFESERYIHSIIDIDKEIGRLVDELIKLGIYKDTVISIVTDHGNYKAKRTGNLESFFINNGLQPYDNKTHTGDFDCTFGGLGFFNFPGDSWHEHPNLNQLHNFRPSKSKKTIDLIKMMFKIEGVKYVYYRADDNNHEQGRIKIRMKDGRGVIHKAAIEYKNDKSRYVYDDLDVFGYDNDVIASKMLDKKFHTADEWLEHTHHLDFPMIIDQLPRYFKNPRSCDILVSTCGEICYNYEHGETKSNELFSHDIGLRKSMNVPLIVGGSSIVPQMELEYAKVADIVPTLLEFIGEEPHSSVDGRSLLDWIQ